jgi:hypothetical protein
LAVADHDGVRFVALHPGCEWTPLELKHDLMQGVECVEWNPVAECLAVGCVGGVCVWRLTVGDDGDEDMDAWMTFLQVLRPLPLCCPPSQEPSRVLARRVTASSVCPGRHRVATSPV